MKNEVTNHSHSKKDSRKQKQHLNNLKGLPVLLQVYQMRLQVSLAVQLVHIKTFQFNVKKSKRKKPESHKF